MSYDVRGAVETCLHYVLPDPENQSTLGGIEGWTNGDKLYAVLAIFAASNHIPYLQSRKCRDVMPDTADSVHETLG